MKKQNTKKLAILSLAVMAFSVVSPMFHRVNAAGLTTASIRFDRMKASTSNVNVLVQFTPASTATEDGIRIIFGSGHTVNATASNITTSEASLPAGCTGPTITGNVASAVSAQTVDFATADMTPSTLYCFYITAGIGNSASTGQTVNTLSTRVSSADQDISRVATNVITNDQVTITAKVPPSFSFVLGATSDAFTTDLSSASVVSTAGVTVTMGTNAQTGWTAWLKSANGALNSAATGGAIATYGTINNAPNDLAVAPGVGNEAYVLDVNTASGGVTVDAEYNGTNTTSGGTLNSSDLEAIATTAAPGSSQAITLVGRATIAATTQAAEDYTDTWTVVGAGNF
ncbi:MAG TPA: hypothetical protein VK338_00840 [Candidatus Nitrosocosmicus sp.]|nr:hypothetical protein [Candidatus Nitrosocosmicus sp.]